MKPSFKYIIHILLLGVAYYSTSLLSVWLHHMQGISPFWPAAGLAAAVIYLGGYRYWPGIFLGIVVTGIVWSTSLPLILSDSVMEIGEAFILVYLLRRLHRFSNDFSHIRDVLYLLIAIIPAVLFSGAIEFLELSLLGASSYGQGNVVVLVLIVSHAIGILIIMPLILVWTRPYPTVLSTRARVEAVVLVLIGVAIQQVDFDAVSSPSLWYTPLIYFSLPFSMWAIMRFQAYGATAVNVFIAVLLATTSLQDGSSTFVLAESMMKASVIGTTAIASMMVAAAIIERKRSEHALRQSKAQQQEQLAFSQTVMDTLGQGVFVVNLNEQIEYVNPVYADTVGIAAENLIGRSPKAFIPEAHQYKYDEATATRLAGVSSSYESEIQHRDGHITPVLVTGAPRWENGRVTGSVIINTDLTERKRAQEMVQLVVSKAPNTTLLINQQGEIVFANDLVQRMFGYAPRDLIGQSFHVLIPERIRRTHHKYEQIYYDHPTSKELGEGRVLAAQHRDGHEFQAEVAINPVETADGSMVLVTIVDITSRVRMEQKLRQRESYLRTLVEQAPVGIVIANMNGLITEANPYSVKLLGSPSRKRTIGLNVLTLSTLVESGLSDAFRRAIVSGETVETETWYTSIWGKLVYFSVRIVPHYNENDEQVGILILLEDMTARIQAEEAMLHLQKTESLGVLAGGIAHDFNNLLVAIMAQSSLALRKMDADSPARSNVEKSNLAAKRAADLTSQLLAYSGRGRFHISPLNLNELIKENYELFTATISKHIELTQSLTPNLPLIEADIPQIQQVVMNLIINAAEAIGDNAGSIHLATYVKTIGKEDSQYGTYVTGLLETGDYVRLEVRDTGAGMDAETLKRIFDPFFSTKETGHGLGLAAVLGIVNGHHGALSVSSSENWTVFNILFPVLGEDIVVAEQPPQAEVPAKKSCAMSGTVLIIDDEETVCMAVTDILGLDDIKTIAAYNGRDGVAIYRERQADISIVVLDLSMPGWSGQYTLKELRTVNPQVCIILSSGYSKEDVVQQFDEETPTAFLSKPYGADDLLAVVRENWPSA